MTLYIKNISLVFVTTTLVSTVLGVGNFSAETGVGTERIRPMQAYNNITRQGWHLGWFGYVVRPGVHVCNERGISIENSNYGLHGAHGPTTVMRSDHIISTFDKDLKSAFTDKELFDTYIDEGRYGEAFRMAIDNEQGNLWKRRSVARAKKDIKHLIRNAVLLDDRAAEREARLILVGFEGTPMHAELSTVLTTTEDATRQRLARFMESPALAAFAADVKAQFIQSLWGDEG